MIRRLRDVSSDVEQKDAEAEQNDDADLNLLRRRAEEDRQQQHRRHDRRHDDVHHVEHVTSTEVDGEGDVGKLFVGTTLVGELVASGGRGEDLPFTVLLVRVHVDGVRKRRQVHLGGVVRPGAERQLAALLVERVERYVDLAHCLEDAYRTRRY